MLLLDRKYSLLDNIFVVLLIFGAFIFLMIPSFLKLPFFLFTVPLKYFILLYSIFIIFHRSIKGKSNSLYVKKFLIFFLLFWFLYLCRVFLDLEINMIKNFVFESNGGYYQAILYCVIPSIAIFYLKDISLEWISKAIFILLFIACVLSMFLNFGEQASELQRSAGRFEGAQGMSSIDYGHNGVSLSLLSFYFLSNSVSKKNKLLFIGTFLFGLFVIYLSGSRSPFLALVICLISYLILSKGFFSGGFRIFILCLPFVFLIQNIVSFLEGFGGNFFDRLLSFTQGDDKGGRDLLFSTALNQFLDSPFYGSSFLVNKGFGQGIYPHNLFLESLMALGIIGGGLFLWFLFKFMKGSFYLIRKQASESWIALLFLQYAILSFFSLAIYTHTKFWFLGCMVVFVLSKKKLYEKN